MDAYSFRHLLVSDLVASKLLQQGAVPGIFTLIRKIVWSLIFHPRFSCVFWYRVNRHLYLRRWPGTDFLSARRFYWFGNDISFYAAFGPGLRLVHLSDIVVGGNVKVGAHATILNGVTLGAKRRGENDEMPCIGNYVYIGSGAKVIGGIRIGNNVTIGAMTLCNKNVPDGSVVYGMPPNQVIKPQELPEIV